MTSPLRLGHKPGLGLFNMARFRRDPLTFLSEAARHGDIVRYKLANRQLFLVTDPELIRDLLITHNANFEKGMVLKRAKRILGNGLLTSEGPFHIRQRRLSQPAFHRQRIAHYAEAMVEYADFARSRFPAGQPFDMHERMMTLTLAIAGRTLFGSNVESDARDVAWAMEVLMSLFGFMFMPGSELIEKLPIPAMRRLKQARAKLDTIIYRIIHERRQSAEDKGDLLSMLIRATDEEGDHTGMTDEQLRDECVTLFLAGHETTAVALSFCWMLLAQNPEAEARLHAELDSVLGGRLPTADDYPKLEFAQRVFAEAMRLYPPAWGIGRRATNDIEMGGVRIRRGAVVLASQWVTHRDPRFWPEPERFDPDRFLPEQKSARPRFAYFPFGAGARQCIGESFAWMEGVLVLATIAQQCRFRAVPDYPIKLQAAITLRPKFGIRMTAEQR
jgi:cytochrome P450